MKTQNVFDNIKPENRCAHLLNGRKTSSSRSLAGIPLDSTEFRDIPPNPTQEATQVAEDQPRSRKVTGGTFAEKISPAQRSQLVEWLADHTYDEVAELVAAEAPAGFGIKVGKTTLCRFYKANFREIDALRRAHLQARSMNTVDDPHDGDYRYVLRHSTAQLLLERLWELLSRPVQSADELKKLAAIAEKLNSIDMDKQDENDNFQDSLLQIFARPAKPAAASNPAASTSAVAPSAPGTESMPNTQP